MYIRQLTMGLGETGLNRPAFWGVYMVNFIFLIGVSMAGTLISAALQLTNSNWRRPITRVAETMTVFGLIIAALQIVFDMGRPERMLFVVQFGRLQSPLLWDFISMTAYILTSIVALFLQLLPDIAILRDNFPTNGPGWRHQLYTVLALGWRGNREQWRRLEIAIKVISVLIIPIGVSLHTVTSWIFSTTVQPGWKSTILGPYFVVGAIFSGIGMLFIVMTIFRQRMRLQDYFKDQQYRNLAWLFIVMSGVWFYFTYTEHLTLAAGQEVMEFPVLASKLWGTFASTFWGMVILMVLATWVLIAPRLMPNSVARVATFQLRLALPLAGMAVLAGVVAVAPELIPAAAIVPLEDPVLRIGMGTLAVILTANALLSAALWFKRHFVISLVFASACVVVGMWLERWNIIIPTVTHPRLVSYSTYLPSLTELSITAASFALLVLLSLVFFKLFPPISIWETAEGRVIEAEYAKVTIPLPESSNVPRRTRGFRRR
jgi:Ni/Fe-hydrogenase subunit HybB-like protein